jgi:hypothetical protein
MLANMFFAAMFLLGTSLGILASNQLKSRYRRSQGEHK